MNLPLHGDASDLPNAKLVACVGTSAPVETHVVPEERNPCWERVLNVACDCIPPGSELEHGSGEVVLSIVNQQGHVSTPIHSARIPLKARATLRTHCYFYYY
jgi:hypothetical protein